MTIALAYELFKFFLVIGLLSLFVISYFIFLGYCIYKLYKRAVKE